MIRYFLHSLVILFVCVSSISAKTFYQEGIVTDITARFFFPQLQMTQLDRVHTVQLDSSVRPNTWPTKVPFGTGIDYKLKRAFYIYYRSLFSRHILPIEHEGLTEPTDICADEKGNIFVADKKANRIFHFLFNAKDGSLTFAGEIRISAPVRCDISKNGRLFVSAADHRLSIVRYDENGYRVEQGISERFRRQIGRAAILDMTSNRHHDVFVLTPHSVLRFDALGTLLKKMPLKETAVAIDSALFGDIVVLFSEPSEIRKYSTDFIEIDRTELPEMKDKSKDMTVYEPLGYIMVTFGKKGVYYAQGVDVKELRVNKTASPSKDENYLISFFPTFPALVTVKVYDQDQTLRQTIIAGKKLMSAPHQVAWNGLDGDGQKLNGPVTIVVRAKGLYSLGNVMTRSITLTF